MLALHSGWCHADARHMIQPAHTPKLATNNAAACVLTHGKRPGHALYQADTGVNALCGAQLQQVDSGRPTRGPRPPQLAVQDMR